MSAHLTHPRSGNSFLLATGKEPKANKKLPVTTPQATKPLSERYDAVFAFVQTFRTDKEAGEALGLSPSQMSKLLNPDTATRGRLSSAEGAIALWRQTTGKVDGGQRRKRSRTQDAIRPGYTTEDEWSDRNGYPRPDAGDATAPEPFAPPGIVLALVFTNDRGEPVYGFDHTGKVHQLGRAIQARVGLSSTASAGGGSK